MSECLHESWECTPSNFGNSLHVCTDCDFRWMSRGSYGVTEQDGDCAICGQPGTNKTSGYITKDSGKREEFESGAVRDTQDDKPRYDLIPPKGLKRVAELYSRGAVKYNDHNWRKGMPCSRFMASLMRHVEAYRRGERDEDHLAAVCFNALAMLEFEDTKWDDLADLWDEDVEDS